MRKQNIFVLLFVFLISFNEFSYFKVTVSATSLNQPMPFTIVVDLSDCKLLLFKNSSGKIAKEFPIAGGKYYSPSPIGTWRISEKGKWNKGFGTRWMGLNVPWGTYGIHGTNKPYTIGSAASLGCIRMFNKDVEVLYNLVPIGTLVLIYGGPYNLNINSFRLLIPGNRGADVFEVQRRLKNIGYYRGALDGIYGEMMKKDVINFRKDKHLPISHKIDYRFYHALNIYSFEWFSLFTVTFCHL